MFVKSKWIKEFAKTLQQKYKPTSHTIDGKVSIVLYQSFSSFEIYLGSEEGNDPNLMINLYV